jgi:hypothetical protein
MLVLRASADQNAAGEIVGWKSAFPRCTAWVAFFNESAPEVGGQRPINLGV